MAVSKSLKPIQLKFGRLDIVFLVLFAGAILGVLTWAFSGTSSYWKAFFDSSIVLEQRWTSSRGRFVENGRAYDQAQLELPPDTELVLPMSRNRSSTGRNVSEEITVSIRDGGPTGVVSVLIEKELCYFGHPPESLYLRDFRDGIKVWTRQVDRLQALDIDAGMLTIEGGSRVRVLVTVPTGLRVRQEPLTSVAFAGRYKDEWQVSEDDAKLAGWNEVPQRPLPRKQFR